MDSSVGAGEKVSHGAVPPKEMEPAGGGPRPPRLAGGVPTTAPIHLSLHPSLLKHAVSKHASLLQISQLQE